MYIWTTYHMYGSAILRVTSKHPRPHPPPEISQYDCAEVDCTQRRKRGAIDSGQIFGFGCQVHLPPRPAPVLLALAHSFQLHVARYSTGVR